MTFLWLFLAAVCGAVLFHTSQQVTDGRNRLATLNEDVRKEDETIRVLQAEWSYLNQPDRLEKLSKEYLDLAPLKGRQFTKLSDIPDRAEAPAVADAAKPAAETAEKPAAMAEAKPVAAKPAPAVKIRKAAVPPAPVHKPAPITASGNGSRSFDDVMKSLGVH
jgi:hypothetical protein